METEPCSPLQREVVGREGVTGAFQPVIEIVLSHGKPHLGIMVQDDALCASTQSHCLKEHFVQVV